MSWLKKLFGRGDDDDKHEAAHVGQERPPMTDAADTGESAEEQARMREQMEKETAEQREQS